MGVEGERLRNNSRQFLRKPIYTWTRKRRALARKYLSDFRIHQPNYRSQFGDCFRTYLVVGAKKPPPLRVSQPAGKAPLVYAPASGDPDRS